MASVNVVALVVVPVTPDSVAHNCTATPSSATVSVGGIDRAVCNGILTNGELLYCHATEKKTYFVLHVVVEIPTPVSHLAIRASEI